jgi:hypothetical protein
MCKENVAYTYNGILFSLKKEGKSGTCLYMDDLEEIMLSEISHHRDSSHLRYLELLNT